MGLPWLVAGALCSLLTFGITAAANVPLNRRLDQAGIETEPQRHAARQGFEDNWNRWNLVRTLTSLGAFVSLTVAGLA